MSIAGVAKVLGVIATVWTIAKAATGNAAPAQPSGGTDTPVPMDDPATMTKKQRLYAQLRSLPELTEDQRLFLMLVAHGESGYSPTAFNDSAGEADAARRAYERIKDRFASCPWPASVYTTGSGGRFGRLVPYYANDLRGVVPCIDPRSISDGVTDIVSAIANAHALQGYSSWQGNVASLRAGWATPGWMKSPPPEKVEKWRRHAREAGLMGPPPADGGLFVDRTLTRFPGPAALPGILARLQGGIA